MNRMKSLTVSVFAFFIATIGGVFMLSAPALAACTPTQDILGIPTWYKNLESEEVSGKCKPVLNGASDTLPIGLAVLEAMLTLGGVVAVVMVFIGGFKFVLSQGEPDGAAGARKTVINAIIGLVIIIVATRVVSFIGGRLG